MEFPDQLEDFAQPEIGLAAVAVAALFSPRVRKGLRWGLVQGVSGVLAAGDHISALARQLTSPTQRALDGSFRQQLLAEARVEQAKRDRADAATKDRREP